LSNFNKLPIGYFLEQLNYANFKSIIDCQKLKGELLVKIQTTWRDHPLYGEYEGQRAIKLGGKWRAIYEIKNHIIKFIEMQEITPHDY